MEDAEDLQVQQTAITQLINMRGTDVLKTPTLAKSIMADLTRNKQKGAVPAFYTMLEEINSGKSFSDEKAARKFLPMIEKACRENGLGIPPEITAAKEKIKVIVPEDDTTQRTETQENTVEPQAENKTEPKTTQPQPAPQSAKKSNAGVICIVVIVVVLLGYMFVIKPQQEAKRIAEMQRLEAQRTAERQRLEAQRQKQLRIEEAYGMVFIKGGTFKMGNNSGYDENPVHDVTLSNYYIGKYEVTQDEWKTFMGSNPSLFPNDPESGEIQKLRPVENISWYDAIIYCNKRSVAEGKTPCYAENGNKDKITNSRIGTVFSAVTCDWTADGYRLPTEAEWEYAARGGGKASVQAKYSGSDKINEVAWYDGNSDGKTHQVGLKKPNAAGVYDMSGNVWEWCWDWYGKYPSGGQSDPVGTPFGENRVIRSGRWYAVADIDDCYVSRRSHLPPDYKNIYYGLGFRVACRNFM